MRVIPRPEYPRPQMVRPDWMNLNGQWEFEIDRSVSGKARGLQQAQKLAGTITVPFCPESELSGVGETDFLNCVWYRREVTLPGGWTENGRQTFLHFGAVDYKATVYINGKEAAVHLGGYTPFSVNITPYLEENRAVITLCAEDDVRSRRQPGGKQSREYGSYECYYTRTTGIWQTVWLENVAKDYICSVQYYPDVENGRLRITAKVCGSGCMRAQAFYQGKPVGQAYAKAVSGQVDLLLELAETHLWEIGQGRLYDLELSFGEDSVTSYFGMRSVRMEGMKFLLNGKSVFQRLVLDQGFYPDGIYTAPTEEALVRDIQLALDCGFTGARLHEKVFEPLYLYHCDRMGYMVWGEYANWSLDTSDYYALAAFLPEWTELMERDFNHPSIMLWCPFNETWDVEGRKQRDEVISTVYHMTKLLDPTRPCIDTSGNFHVVTDIFDLHDYEQDPALFKQKYENLCTGASPEKSVQSCQCGTDRRGKPRQIYRGEPLIFSEYGGIKWDVHGNAAGWGYGDGPATEAEFIERYRALTQLLLDSEKFCGFCYTQLYDVEQEVNGLYTYERKPKFDMEIIKAINSGPAAIEE